MRKFIFSAVMGMLALVLVNLTFPITGVSLSLNYLTFGISSVLGVLGVITMLVLGVMLG